MGHAIHIDTDTVAGDGIFRKDIVRCGFQGEPDVMSRYRAELIRLLFESTKRPYEAFPVTVTPFMVIPSAESVIPAPGPLDTIYGGSFESRAPSTRDRLMTMF